MVGNGCQPGLGAETGPHTLRRLIVLSERFEARNAKHEIRNKPQMPQFEGLENGGRRLPMRFRALELLRTGR